MSFPIIISASSPRSLSPEYRSDAPETQPLIEHESNFPPDTKQEPDTQPIITPTTPAPSSPLNLAAAEDYPGVTEGSIRLESPEELQAPHGTSRFLRNLRPENRSVVDDMTRGFLMLITTPIAFVGMGLYALGMIIEGIALMVKGVGSLTARVLMKRRGRSQPASPETQWV